MEADREYSLEYDLNQIKSFLPYANNPDVRVYDERYNKALLIEYKEEYSGMANFKRYTFKCTNVEYDDNGRVSLMEFQQV